MKSLIDGANIPLHLEHVTLERSMSVNSIEHFKNKWQVTELSKLLPGSTMKLPKLDDDNTLNANDTEEMDALYRSHPHLFADGTSGQHTTTRVQVS